MICSEEEETVSKRRTNFIIGSSSEVTVWVEREVRNGRRRLKTEDLPVSLVKICGSDPMTYFAPDTAPRADYRFLR